MTNKPLALTGLAFLLGIVGLMLLFIAFGAIPLIGNGQGGGWLAILFGVTAVACFVLAYGLFALKPWAWPMGIGLAVASIVLTGLSVISRATLAGLVISLAPAIFLLGGLFLPDVRKALGRERSAKPTTTGASKINQPNPNPQEQTQHKEHKTGRRK
jgi:hypothetical protein